MRWVTPTTELLTGFANTGVSAYLPPASYARQDLFAVSLLNRNLTNETLMEFAQLVFKGDVRGGLSRRRVGAAGTGWWRCAYPAQRHPHRRHLPPFCHDGTERRIERSNDATEQATCYSGKKRAHPVKNLLLVDRLLTILLLTDTYPGSVHDKRIADAHPYPLPSGSWLLQDLGFLAFTLADVECLTPFKKTKAVT